MVEKDEKNEITEDKQEPDKPKPNKACKKGEFYCGECQSKKPLKVANSLL